MDNDRVSGNKRFYAKKESPSKSIFLYFGIIRKQTTIGRSDFVLG
jgi:hypothetical protein